MSSWLDNLAAHVEEEEEEESPERVPTSTTTEQKDSNQPQTPAEPSVSQEEVQKPENSEKIPSTPISENPKQIEEKSETQKIEQPVSTPIPETSPKEKAKQNPYSGPISKEMKKVDTALHNVEKRQEFLYASSMIKTRSSLDYSLEKTSKPIQTIGGLGKVSNEAKQKYDFLQRKIMSISPLCSVTPKSE